MFNTARYNLQRYNLQSNNETDIPIKNVLTEVFHSTVGYAENSYIIATLPEQFKANVTADSGYYFEVTCNEGLKNKLKAYVELYSEILMSEGVYNELFLSADNYRTYDLAESIENYTYIGCDSYHIIPVMNEELHGKLWLSADRYEPTLVLFEIYQCEATTITFNTQTLYLNVVIPPGGELIIDSNNFVVLLNGDNAIHTHSGDWPTLCRETYDFIIAMGQYAPFEATMIYEERFL